MMITPNYRDAKILIQMQFDPFSLSPVDVEWIETHGSGKTSVPQKSSEKERRRLREEQADGQYTEQEWSDLKVKYSNCCLRCGSTEKQIVADHIQPMYRGGSNGIENIQPLCWECNLWKGLKIIDFRPDSHNPGLSQLQ
jgi:5-methylcytosine-specific restriction endonuclease McrA